MSDVIDISQYVAFAEDGTETPSTFDTREEAQS